MPGLGENSLEPAGGSDAAGSSDTGFAVDDLWIPLAEVEQFSEFDRLGVASQLDSAPTTALGLEEIVANEFLTDFRDVVGRETVGFRDFS